ncbi:MAG TPA: hypothetical protein VL068_10505, partial [Microthrixaceae bacterium]|nr:hypothetical protein [Microthrixaceae bacterium]
PGDGQKNRSNGLLVALGVIFVVLALGAGGCVALVVSGRQGSVKDESARSDRVTAPTTTAEYQREPSTVPETSTEPETPATTEPESPPETAPPTTLVPAPPSTKAPSSIMPDVVCMDLQQAQDTIQSAGVFFSRSFDAAGAGRNQIIDRNWIVVSQDPPAGAPIDGVQPNLGAVKKNEPSPC